MEDSLCLRTKSTRLLAQTPDFELLSKQKLKKKGNSEAIGQLPLDAGIFMEHLPATVTQICITGQRKKTGLDLTEEL